jgi:hypothetical protein
MKIRIPIALIIFIHACTSQVPEEVFKSEIVRNDTILTFFSPGKPRSIKPFLIDSNITPEDTFVNKLTHGLCTFYYTNGKIKSTLNYKRGNRHGEAIMYYETGELYVKEHYTNGQLNGEKIKYFTNGSPIIRSWYKEGYHSKTSELYSFTGEQLVEPALAFKLEDLRLQKSIVRLHMNIENLKKIRRVTYYITSELNNDVTLHYELDVKKGIGFQEIKIPAQFQYVAKIKVSAKYTLSSGEIGGVIGNHNLVLFPLI